MPVDTRSDVDEISNVRDEDGEKDRPANVSRQKTIQSLISTVKSILSNSDTLATARYTTDGTDAEQLPANAVKDGGMAVVVPLRGNSGSVYVGDENNQPVTLESPKDAFEASVSDLSEIWIRTPQAGDGVGVTFEQ